jgi:hypothetical protein
MNHNKHPLQHVIRKASRFLTFLCEVVMDPTGLDDLNAYVLSQTRLSDPWKRWITVVMTRVVFLPYTVLRFMVNSSRLFNKQRAPSMGPLVKATDFFPSPKTRKLLKKMVADQGTHIESLSDEGRFKTARWIWFSTWFLLVWYGCHSLITTVAKAIRGRAA